ncbi:MAG: hypothetical protein LBR56_01150 [Sporomusaceae bacterium]|jgi:flagellin|nr:hypothetical protein [Sporomusaceae bacterium]
MRCFFVILNTNVNALNTLQITNILSAKSANVLEKLSSGLNINRAADDAAGVAISEKMRGQIRGLEQAGRNIQDGISFVQVADGSLGTVHDILQRGKELCVQAANDTNTQQDREQLNEELEKLSQEIDKIGTDAEFNTIKIFTNAAGAPSMASLAAPFAVDVIKESSVSFDTTTLTNDQQILVMAAEVWVASALDAIYSTFPNLITNDAPESLQIVLSGGASTVGGTMKSTFTSSGPATSFVLTLNKNLFNTTVNGFDNSGGLNWGGLLADQLVAHEMTHAVLADNLAYASYKALPDWFEEGLCEAIAGGFQLRMGATPNSALQSQLGNGTVVGNYHSGYAAVMYLGYLAGNYPSGTSNMGNVTAGISKILDELKAGKKFNDALLATTGLTQAQFTAQFKTSAAVTQFLDELRGYVGSGSGSILNTGGGPLKASLQDTIDGITNPSISNNHFVVSNPLPGHVIAISTDTSAAPVPPGGAPGGAALTPFASGGLIIQLGANSNQNLTIDRFAMSAADLGVPDVTLLSTQASYNEAIGFYDNAVELVSSMRSYYGATQNRLEFALENANVAAVNTQASESRLRDANMAELMLEFTKTNILTQSATAMLAQANQLPQSILTILR